MPIYGIIICVIIVVSLISSYIFSSLVLRSRRQLIVLTPEAYGLAYEDVEFKSKDGLTIKGWFVPAGSGNSSDKIIIQTHPMFFNRHGFVARGQGFPPLAFTDVDLLKTTQVLNQAGYSVLTFDFRNHGESDPGLSGVGLTEYQDVLGALEYVKNRWSPDIPIGFVSFCMGANSTMTALSKGRDQVGNVKFLAAIQPVSAGVFVRCYLSAVYTPLMLYLYPIVDWLDQLRGGFAFKEMSPLPFAHDLELPVLYVQAERDRWTDLKDIQSFYEATPGPKEMWLFTDVKKRFEGYNFVGENPERILAFIRKYFP
jgi:pimeloyl-ACP methyl ester carboxylesterase